MNFDIKKNLPKRVTVIGAARSGLAAAEFFTERGVSVFISDTCPEEKLVSLLKDKKLGIQFEAVAHTPRCLQADLIVLSPGVSSDIPVLVEARKAGIPVWSEMELGYRASDATFLAITGSTGKSTSVSLLGAALTSAGKENVVAGNIGLPIISVSPKMTKDAFVVAEVSSFQLETIDSFHPHVAAVLNFMKNHLDRYKSEEDYYDAKKQIARNLTKDDFLVLNISDSRLVEWAEEMKKKTNIIFFGSSQAQGDSVWYDGQVIRYSVGGRSGIVLDTKEMAIEGRHNYENAAVASAMAIAAGIDPALIGKGICEFKGLEHRLEYVAKVNGVRFFNDSKSTTAESVICAVKAFESGVHLIAGGKDKFCDFSICEEVIKKHVKDITLIGEAADRMESQWKGFAPISKASTLQGAIELALSKSNPGDVVVFSPGCASFDMFKNYEHRGQVFKELVHALTKVQQ